MTNYKNKLSGHRAVPVGRQGFTLIELLIVIAILGVLAVVVLVAINPVQQLARTRDAGRISGAAQLGHAVQAFQTANNGAPLASSNAWLAALVTAGELSSPPALIANSINQVCGPAANLQNGWCYVRGTAPNNNWLVYSRLEASANIGRCPAPTTNWAYAVYSSADSRGGIICYAANGVPTVPAAGATLGNCTGTTCNNQFLP